MTHADRVAVTGLYSGFEGFRVPRDEVLDDAFATALISVDANVLLDLYRNSDDYSTAMLQALKTLGDRLFVSHQAITEFWRNRMSVLEDRAKARGEVKRRIDDLSKSLRVAVETWAAKINLEEPDLLGTLEIIHRQSELLLKTVDDVHSDDTENYPSPGMDEMVQALEVVLGGHVGDPPSEAQFDEWVAEGSRRHSAQEPPGFKEKAEEKQHLAEGVAGDYLVWAQSIAAAAARGLDLLILTRDQKEDWWWRSRGVSIGPRPELAKEFWTVSGRQLYMSTPARMIRRFRDAGGEVPDAVLDEAAKQGSTTTTPDDDTAGLVVADWTPEAIQELLSRLDADSPVQSAVIRAAAENGGRLERAEVYRLGKYDSTRMLRGFTRPVQRITRGLQQSGLLSVDAPTMLRPRYDAGVQASAFEVPRSVVTLLGEAHG